ncbi:cyclin-T2b isoform X2 [Paralichthys olivaceus]|uniref:cyclin-T2b isoform X2 n=1 Tax=Paralichthys olivaceus TaxID=8255 RepID=UPI00097DA27E|nr:PREDICTED: cyclin-T2-like isoform X2 [Paralichthys olivaceus]
MAVHRGPSTKWLFTREQLENTPSRRCGIEADRELSYRQQAANLIQDIGQKLNVSQLTINTAIVYMHKFYMIHSFTKFHRNIISQTTLFLATKVEEQPRKLELVIKMAHACINPQEPAPDSKSNAFLQQAQELAALETILLQTLGFEITVDHPHTDVVRCCELVRASKDLAQTSYFMATNSLHLTTFCLQYRPTVVACVCIHLACKWSNWEIPVSTDGKHWWEYVDRTVTLQLLDELTHEFLQILEKTPSRLKRIRNWRAIQAAKKPKTQEGAAVDVAFQSSSLDGLSGVANSFFPSTSSSDSMEMPSLNAIAAPYTSYQPISDLSKSCNYDQFSQPPHSDFTLVKHEHKSAGGSSSKHQQLDVNAAAFPRSQKILTLEKYREKHAAELAMQNGGKDEPDMYAPPPALSSHHHKKRSQSQQARQAGEGRSDKPSSKKPRLAPSFAENGSATSEELKMRIKVSSERHGGAEQGGTLPGKDKHKEHSSHRHLKHGHAYSLSGNGRGTIDNTSLSLRAPSSNCNDGSSSSSSRKRPHSDATNHHHHSSKSSRSSKAGLSSSHYASDGGHRMMEHHGHDGTNGMLTTNGQHTDYKDTFDMLDSLLSAQGMNL